VPGTAPPDPAPRPHPPAARQAAARTALLRSALWYGRLSPVLLVVRAMSGRDSFWPIWPILGFALLLGWQAFSVLGPQPEDQGRRRDRGPDVGGHEYNAPVPRRVLPLGRVGIPS